MKLERREIREEESLLSNFFQMNFSHRYSSGAHGFFGSEHPSRLVIPCVVDWWSEKIIPSLGSRLSEIRKEGN